MSNYNLSGFPVTVISNPSPNQNINHFFFFASLTPPFDVSVLFSQIQWGSTLVTTPQSHLFIVGIVQPAFASNVGVSATSRTYCIGNLKIPDLPPNIPGTITLYYPEGTSLLQLCKGDPYSRRPPVIKNQGTNLAMYQGLATGLTMTNQSGVHDYFAAGGFKVPSNPNTIPPNMGDILTDMVINNDPSGAYLQGTPISYTTAKGDSHPNRVAVGLYDTSTTDANGNKSTPTVADCPTHLGAAPGIGQSNPLIPIPYSPYPNPAG